MPRYTSTCRGYQQKASVDTRVEYMDLHDLSALTSQSIQEMHAITFLPALCVHDIITFSRELRYQHVLAEILVLAGGVITSVS